MEDARNMPALLVEVTRGPITESRHYGHVVAVDGDGQIVAQLGAPEVVTYLRSSAKPLQAVPLVSTGAADRFNFTPQEVAGARGRPRGGPRLAPVPLAATGAADRSTSTPQEIAVACGSHSGEPVHEETIAAMLRKIGL